MMDKGNKKRGRPKKTPRPLHAQGLSFSGVNISGRVADEPVLCQNNGPRTSRVSALRAMALSTYYEIESPRKVIHPLLNEKGPLDSAPKESDFIYHRRSPFQLGMYSPDTSKRPNFLNSVIPRQSCNPITSTPQNDTCDDSGTNAHQILTPSNNIPQCTTVSHSDNIAPTPLPSGKLPTSPPPAPVQKPDMTPAQKDSTPFELSNHHTQIGDTLRQNVLQAAAEAAADSVMLDAPQILPDGELNSLNKPSANLSGLSKVFQSKTDTCVTDESNASLLPDESVMPVGSFKHEHWTEDDNSTPSCLFAVFVTATQVFNDKQLNFSHKHSLIPGNLIYGASPSVNQLDDVFCIPDRSLRGYFPNMDLAAKYAHFLSTKADLLNPTAFELHSSRKIDQLKFTNENKSTSQCLMAMYVKEDYLNTSENEATLNVDTVIEVVRLELSFKEYPNLFRHE